MSPTPIRFTRSLQPKRYRAESERWVFLLDGGTRTPGQHAWRLNLCPAQHIAGLIVADMKQDQEVVYFEKAREAKRFAQIFIELGGQRGRLYDARRQAGDEEDARGKAH